MHLPDVPRIQLSRRVLTQKLVGDVRLVLQAAGRPSHDEIAQHIAEALRMAGSVRVVLVIADGPDAAGPDAAQRAKMARAGMLRIPTAVVTESVLARRIMTAVSWIGGGSIRAFAPEQLHRAFEFLKISPPVRARIPAQLEALRAELRVMSLAPELSRPPAADQIRIHQTRG